MMQYQDLTESMHKKKKASDPIIIMQLQECMISVTMFTKTLQLLAPYIVTWKHDNQFSDDVYVSRPNNSHNKMTYLVMISVKILQLLNQQKVS